MSYRAFAIALICIALTVPVGARAQPSFALKSASIVLPNRGIRFSGPGAEAVNENCLTCHSAGMVLNQPMLPAAAWKAEAEKMIHVYKAPVDEKDVAAIVDYLARVKGQ